MSQNFWHIYEDGHPSALMIHDDETVFTGTLPLSMDENLEPETNGNVGEWQSRSLLNRYLDLRDQAATLEKPKGDDLVHIQQSVQKWIMANGLLAGRPKYGAYERDGVSKRLLGLADFLREHHGTEVSEPELEATQAFVEAAFSMYESTPEHDQAGDADGSFAFVVPMRASKSRPDYGQEVEMVCPALRYVPNELRGQLAIGVPPLVLDTYQVDQWGKRGYLVLAPIFPDMQDDLPGVKALPLANRIVNDTVDFAHRRLGAEIVGLGAVLPSLTNYGKHIKNNQVITTTGHGGTTHLILETIKAAHERGALSDDAIKHLGVLGLGSIGKSIADLAAEHFPDSQIHIYDKNLGKMKKSLQGLGHRSNIMGAASSEDVISRSGVIISAIVGKIALSDGTGDLAGKLFVDDSQPGSLDRQEVERAGGSLVWVIGHDTDDLVVRRGYDYGSLFNRHRDVFGCEAEAAALARYSQELREQGVPDDERIAMLRRVALREPVTAERARMFGKLFADYGIVVAEPQVNGKIVSYPTQAHIPRLRHESEMLKPRSNNRFWSNIFKRLAHPAII